MSNIMNDLRVKNHVSRNGFDRSQRVCFTAKVGEILPVSYFDILPGDSLRLKLNSFGRTQPVQTATFARFREYYDVFFVPYRLLWDKFPAFVVGSSNAYHAQSSTEGVPNFSSMPFSYLGQLFLMFTHDYYNDAWDAPDRSTIVYDDGGLPAVESAARLLRYLGYPFDVYMEKDSAHPGYYKFKDKYSNPTSDNLLMTSVSLMPLLAYQKVYQDYFRFPQWEQATPQSYNLDYILRDADLQIYGPNYRQLSMRYCNYDKDYFLGRMPNSQFGDVANVTAYINPEDTQMDVNLNDVEVSLKGHIVSKSHSASATSSMGWTQGLRSTSAFLNTGSVYNDDIVLPLLDEANVSLDDPTGKVVDNKTILSQWAGGRRAYADLQGLYTQFTILALRRAQAVQKLREITQLSSPDYKSQMAAHWNVNVSDSESYLCKHLGGCSANLDVSEVINNNLAADSDIASIHGRGIITGNGSLDYKFNEHGILLVTYHVKPIPEYEQTKIFNRNLFKLKQTDFPQPEFDRIGMQELHYFEANMDAAAFETGNTDKAFEPIGYVPRYCEYKTNVDVIKGEFLNSLKPWVLPFTQYAEPNDDSSSYLQFKVKANVADNIFGLQATADSSTDVFLNSLYLDAKFVSNLDRNGMPY